MPLIFDIAQKSKLKDMNINIKTKYIVGSKILERNTDDSHNDDIENGIRCEKMYFFKDNLLHTENVFDSRIEYTFISNAQGEEEYTCPNCGIHSKLKNFVDGCPYCGTYYNLDYVSKNMGGKYHYDIVMRSNTYKIIIGLVDFIISFVLSFFFIKNTSRTFNFYDISKIFVYSSVLTLILYYLFYVIDGRIILGPLKLYKDIQNRRQIKFWDKIKLDQRTFYNNLNYEIGNKYYNNSDIIDYDILDFDRFSKFKKGGTLYVKVKAYVRVVRYVNGKFKSKYITDNYILRKVNKDDVLQVKDGVNIIKCYNCGASIDATKKECEYCGTAIKGLQEWVLEK